MTGTTISHYRIVSELGKGGMGVVYQAEDTKLDRTVALKLLAPHMLASETDRARFYREARAAAALHHPNIATVFEIDETADGRPFIVMEYIEGKQLDEGLLERPLPVERAVEIAIQIAEALKEAHSQGIVHRDIKSANVMLTKAGTAIVLDFGLAKTNASTKLTQMGSTVGTIAYMSPEQARGEEVDRRTDLWSLGAALYEMLTGRLPFPGSYEQAVVYGILNAEPEPVTALRTGVPVELESVVLKCLRKDRELRYQSAPDVMADLRALGNTPGESRRTSLVPSSTVLREPTGRTAPRWVWPLVATVALVGLGVGWVLAGTPETQRPAWRDLAVGYSEMGFLRIIALSPGGERAVVESGSEGAEMRVLNLQSGEFSQGLDVAPGAAPFVDFSEDGERILISSWWSALGGVRSYRASDGVLVASFEGQSAAWGHDGSVVFFREDRQGVFRVGPSGGQPELLVEPDSSLGHELISHMNPLPGGRSFIAMAWSRNLTSDLILIEGDSYRVIKDGASSPSFVAPGHVVFLDGWGPDPVMVQAFDARGGSFLGSPAPIGIGLKEWGRIAVAENGDLAYLRNEGEDLLYWLDPELEIEALPFDPGPVSARPGSGWFVNADASHPTISPDGVRVVLAKRVDGGPHLFVHDLRGGSQDLRFYNEEKSGFPTWSHDGRWLYYRTLRNGRPVIAKQSADRGEEIVVLFGKGQIHEPALSPDGKWMAYSEGAPTGDTAWLVSVSDTTDIRRIGDGAARDPSFSPDSRFVVFETERLDASLMVMDLETSRVEGIEASGGAQWNPVWSHDGSYIYFRSERSLWRVPVTTTPSFVSGSPELIADVALNFNFGIHPDGRVLIHGRQATSDTPRIIVNAASLYQELAPLDSRRFPGGKDRPQ